MGKVSHLMVLGATQKGKTFYCNEKHRSFPRFSVFVDTKGIDPLWGAHVGSLRPLGNVRLRGAKVVYDPPRTLSDIDWERARADFEHFWGKVQELARDRHFQQGEPPWIQFLVDEAQKWEEDKVIAAILADMAARGLGMGLQLVYITQYPAGLSTVTRNNLDTRVVFALGDEGRRCIRSWGWPEEIITKWTMAPYHFATSDPSNGWRLHCPIGRGGKACPLHPHLNGQPMPLKELPAENP